MDADKVTRTPIWILVVSGVVSIAFICCVWWECMPGWYFKVLLTVIGLSGFYELQDVLRRWSRVNQ